VRIFLSATSLLPSYGGPAYSVARLAAALADAGAEVGLWTSNQSTLTAPFLHTRAQIRCLAGGAAGALTIFGKVDVLHDNGMWLAHNHSIAVLARQRNIPRVVSTRGMLEPWAVRHKRLKKRVAWWLYQRRDLQQAQLHHTTAAQEARNIERFRLGVPVCVIPNGVDLPEDNLVNRSNPAKEKDGRVPRTALFVGRIYPVKGLLMLVEAWSRVRPNDWRLQIAGPDEAGHRTEVERAVSLAGLREVVSFLGPIEGEAKTEAFSHAELVILPSYSESFGIVVAEALAHGLPVLTTTGTPWSELAKRGCGWWIEPTVEALVQGLRQSTSQDDATLRAMGAKGRTWIAAQFGWDAVAKEFLSAYEHLLAREKFAG
jgi:glycosyltransferase involved in cell wall biosynthesis